MEVVLSMTRLLLPFQHGVDQAAIEQAVRLAKGCDATLFSLSVLQVQAGRKMTGPRLDVVQQSKDFLETAKHLAKVWCTPIELLEVVTHEAGQSISKIASEMQCDGIVLFMDRNSGVLLSSEAIQYLIEAASCKLYIMRMSSSANTSPMQFVRHALARIFNKKLVKIPSSGYGVARAEQPDLIEA